MWSTDLHREAWLAPQSSSRDRGLLGLAQTALEVLTQTLKKSKHKCKMAKPLAETILKTLLKNVTLI